ncbi:hypothetical protein GJ496_002335 [Pomphorhynchus laevis]|nr:hypothetical protein GJ496_002335 [Pomphorhynchus laevis]
MYLLQIVIHLNAQINKKCVPNQLTQRNLWILTYITTMRGKLSVVALCCSCNGQRAKCISNCHTFECSNKQKMCSESTNAKEPVDIDMHYNNAWEAFGGRTVLLQRLTSKMYLL